jgi:beta-mannosidase
VRLDGDEWQLRACLGDEWRWHVGRTKPWDAPGWVPARVPGSVLDDLVRAGEAPSPYHERDSRLSEWVPERSWIYRRRFAVAGERATLRLHGVDHSCVVLVDGVELARHDGMFVPFDVDVSSFADGREHLLAVVVRPAPENEPQVGVTRRVRVHKSRMGYGWDFCPRLVHQGIWQPVTLYVDEPPTDLQPLVSVEDGAGVVRATGPLELLDGGHVVATGVGEVRVDRPRLWWPNGLGEQHLYRLRAAGQEWSIGFRTVELVPNEGAPQDALPYTLLVNGRRLFANGWNWCPVDPLYGVPRPEKLERLLTLAARAHVNLLRVWGGGLIETPSFYGLCDRLGLLVWQEFSQSSSGMESVPADDEEFVELMRGEARAIVPRLRHHPSLALWCGGNELAQPDPERDDRPLDDSHPVLGALHEVVRELDPGRGWLPTSPSGPRFLNRLDIIREDPNGQYDVHGPWEHQGLERHYELYDAGTCLLHSEFGVEGMTNRRSLEALLDEPRRWPADRSNPVYEHLGAWWNNAPLVQEAFGGRIHDVDAMRRASQQLQYDGLRYAVEANRRRFPRCSGTLPWQLHESFPNAWCTAAVDYHGDPKPAYWGVARAYAPVHVCASFASSAWAGRTPEARVWAWSWEAHKELDVCARLVTVDGATVSARTWHCALGEVANAVGEIAGEPPSEVFVLDLSVADGDRLLARNRYAMTNGSTLAPLLRLEPANVEVELADQVLALRHVGGPAALGIVLEDARPAGEPGWTSFATNVLDLLPGEEVEIEVDACGDILVSGWNLEAVRCST